MLLRASGAIAGDSVDVSAIADPAGAARSGIPHAAVLLHFADAVAGTDDAALGEARVALLHDLGEEHLVDAAAVASNFERMVRVADATGTPLDGPLLLVSEALRHALDLDRFPAASATPQPSLAWRLVGRALEPLAMQLLRLWGRVRGGS